MVARLWKYKTIGVCLVGVILVGCSDDSKKARKVKKVDGIAKKIDLKNNFVSMVTIDKNGKEFVREGTLREDTEVSINGRAAKLDEVREGDKVSVYGFKEGKDDDVKFVATKVEVTRAAEGGWKSTTATKPATTQPAGKP
ncbi:MAG: hypothetical protein AABZ08_02365 [Planctomycetota bacterium]